MRVVRIKKTGQALYVTGAVPKKKGDRFEATDDGLCACHQRGWQCRGATDS